MRGDPRVRQSTHVCEMSPMVETCNECPQGRRRVPTGPEGLPPPRRRGPDSPEAPPALIGLRVRVYYDSTRGTYSVKLRGKVVAKANTLTLHNVSFVVNERQRDKIRAGGRKTPHAFVQGELAALAAPPPGKGRWVRFHYNPRKTDGFVDGEGRVLSGAAVVALGFGAPRRPVCLGRKVSYAC